MAKEEITGANRRPPGRTGLRTEVQCYEGEGRKGGGGEEKYASTRYSSRVRYQYLFGWTHVMSSTAPTTQGGL